MYVTLEIQCVSLLAFGNLVIDVSNLVYIKDWQPCPIKDQSASTLGFADHIVFMRTGQLCFGSTKTPLDNA